MEKKFEYPDLREISTIDLYRINLINQFTDEQKVMFGLGLGLYQACITHDQINLGVPVSSSDIIAMENVKKFLKEVDLPWYGDINDQTTDTQLS